MGGARTLATLEGYLTSQIFYIPLALGVFMSLLAAKLINREIGSGAMDILLSHPITRVSVVAQKYGGAAMLLAILALVFALALWLAGLTIDDDISFSDSVLVGLNLMPISLFYFSVAFAIACFSRGPNLPIGIGCGLTGLTWVLHGLSQSTEMFAKIEKWTIFYWYIQGKPFSDGLVPQHMIMLFGLSVVLAAAGALQFRRRDF
jgi:ABC-2 type transport system permease protein